MLGGTTRCPDPLRDKVRRVEGIVGRVEAMDSRRRRAVNVLELIAELRAALDA
jgi:hypothetical protein